MPIMICGDCGKRVPDSFHDWEDPCTCIDWIEHYKENGWILQLNGKRYDFSKKE